jgi:hypothetical protein
VIVHHLLDVVNVDVVAEDRPRVGGFSSIGVPVKGMNDARSEPTRLWPCSQAAQLVK